MRLTAKQTNQIKVNHKLIEVIMGAKIYGGNSISNSNVLYKQTTYRYGTNNSKTHFLNGWAYISFIEYKLNGLDSDAEIRAYDSVESANKAIDYLGRNY